jgi:hypothetical protein
VSNQQQASGTADLSAVLTALGVPNSGGHLSWPLGLRILPPAEETRDLRQQLDGLVQLLAVQAAGGQVNANALQEATRLVDRLHTLLRDRRDALRSSVTYDEAESFLNRLESTLKALK